VSFFSLVCSPNVSLSRAEVLHDSTLETHFIYTNLLLFYFLSLSLSHTHTHTHTHWVSKFYGDFQTKLFYYCTILFPKPATTENVLKKTSLSMIYQLFSSWGPKKIQPTANINMHANKQLVNSEKNWTIN